MERSFCNLCQAKLGRAVWDVNFADGMRGRVWSSRDASPRLKRRRVCALPNTNLFGRFVYGRAVLVGRLVGALAARAERRALPSQAFGSVGGGFHSGKTKSLS